MDDAVLDRLAQRCESLHLASGQPVYHAGDESVGAFVVVDGHVQVTRAGRDGVEHALQVAGPATALGDLPLARGERQTATAVATEPTRLLFLSRHAVEGVYRGDPDVAHAIIQSLARRLRDLSLRALALRFRDVVPRLAVLLAAYAERVGAPSSEGGVELELGRTQEELAHEIGAARESVSRAWGQLRDQRLIEPRRGHRLHIPDLQALRAIAGM
jgi:CRP-like cAMP-binding protein